MKEGNVVISYGTDTHLMLDCDLKLKDEVIKFSRKYAKFHDLGSAAVFETSDADKIDIHGNRLGNYCVIFGRIISWEECKWHLEEALRLVMVDKDYVDIMCKSGCMTIRVNTKNSKKHSPTLIDYFHNGDSTGITAFINHWKMCRDLGNKE